MLTFIRDMALGWMIYTEDGRKTSTRIAKNVYKMVRKNLENNPQVQNFMTIKEILLGDDNEESNKTNDKQAEDIRPKD